MARSRRRTPIAGFCADSDKAFKEYEHRRERSAVRIALEQGAAPPSPRAFGNPWNSPKDGKVYGPGDGKMMRK